MKRLIAILLAISCLLSVTAFAEGKLKAVEKNLIVFSGKDSGYFYAKVENVGDAAIGLDSGDLVIFSDDDDILLSNSFITTTPSHVILDPGDYLYVNDFLWDSALKDAVIGDYKLSIPAYKRTKTITKLPCEATFEVEGADTFNNHVYVTFTNNEASTLNNFYVIVALYDAENTLVYVDTYSNSSVSVHPGSTITVTLSIDNDLMEYYQENDITLTTLDAMVCYTNS